MPDHPDPIPPRSSRPRRLLAAVLALGALAVAVPVSGAFAGGDAGSADRSTSTPAVQVQQQQEPEGDGTERRDGRDCPEKDGGGSGRGSSDSAASDTQQF